MKKTLRELHEEAAGMGLDSSFFSFNGINPDEVVEVDSENKIIGVTSDEEK
jgi:hypothetical protein